MTETELHRRLSETVALIEPAPELLDRVRAGGTRRLRRRRLTTVAATALSGLLVGSLAVAGPRILASDDSGVASVNAADPYGNLLKGKTQGDLSGDKKYLQEVTAIWQNSHATSGNNLRGIFNDLRGKPKVAWAGNTPDGRAAIVVQQAYLHAGENFTDELGLRTLAGFIGTGTGGTQQLIADDYAPPGASHTVAFLTGDGPAKTMVILDQGKSVGYSTGRTYAADGSNRYDFTAVTTNHGVGIVQLPAGVSAPRIVLAPLPATGTTDLRVVEAQPRPGSDPDHDTRLWRPFPPANLWPMTAGAAGAARSARAAFNTAIEDKASPYLGSAGMSAWAGYGQTADGSRILLGEYAFHPDPSRVYAVLISESGQTRVVPGGVPDRTKVLPVAIGLPDGQGWAVAQKDGLLSYRLNGSWSTPRRNALLVPADADAVVRVTLRGKTSTVPLG